MKEDWKKDPLLPNKNPLPLNEKEIHSFLQEFSKWKLETDSKTNAKKLVRELKFSNFTEAFAYLTKIAILSEKLDHHAEILNTYSSVRMTIFTHTIQNLTRLDRLFAYQAESFL